MKQLVEYKLKDGSSFHVEVEVPESEVVTRAGRKDLPAEANMMFEDAINRVKPMATAIVESLRGITDPSPDVEIEFGLKLTANAGAVVASAGAEANYALTLRWPGGK
jgi:hypothetical protein